MTVNPLGFTASHLGGRCLMMYLDNCESSGIATIRWHSHDGTSSIQCSEFVRISSPWPPMSTWLNAGGVQVARESTAWFRMPVGKWYERHMLHPSAPFTVGTTNCFCMACSAPTTRPFLSGYASMGMSGMQSPIHVFARSQCVRKSCLFGAFRTSWHMTR